jgi:tRNA 2-selenouridine synthase
MSSFSFIPVLGLTGSGKSLFLDQKRSEGHQVVSVEFLAGVTGVCLRNLAETVISARELEVLLTDTLRSFDPAKPVYVEWKPELVHRVDLPAWFVTEVRASLGFLAVESFPARVDRLLTDYAALVDHLDYVVEIFENSAVLSECQMRMLRGYLVADDARGMISYLLQVYFDPLYLQELHRFSSLSYGSFDVSRGAFYGSIVSAPFDFVGLVLDGVLADSKMTA